MSKPDWWAALCEGAEVTLWPVTDGAFGAAERVAQDALADRPGPIVIAGWDVPMAQVPARALSPTCHVPELPHLAAIPMLSQTRPAALSHGAETAIAGVLSEYPSYDGILLVLGRVETLWAHISAEEVVSVQSFLTPSLATALGAAGSESAGFDAALSETLSRPERLAQHLASARASGSGQEHAHLIGAEVAAAKPYWLGQQVSVLSDGDAGGLYLRALAAQGVAAQPLDRTHALQSGFRQAWEMLRS